MLFIRSLLEQSATVWHSSLTEENVNDLERVQKSALKIILQEKYKTYKQALAQLGLESLSERREQLCLNFAEKCLKNILDKTTNGSIVVMHDSEKAKDKIFYTLPKILSYYQEKGYLFKAIS